MIGLTKQQLETAFYCDKDKDKVDFSKVDRLVIDNDIIYLFVDDKIINFKVPYIYKRNGLLFLVKRQPFIQSATRNEETSRIVGQMINKTRSKIETYEIENNKTTLKFYILDFKDKKNPGKRGSLKFVSFYKSLRFFDTQPSNYSFIYLKDQIRYDFRYFKKELIISQIDGDKLFRSSPIIQHRTRFAVYYEYANDSQSNSNNSLIEFDYDNNIHIKQYQFFKLKDGKLDYNILYHKYRIDEFFDCHPDVRRDSSVKGIFSHKTNLFIVVKHHYFIIENVDHIDKNFKSSLIDNNYKNLDFQNYSKEIIFEELSTRWIKVVDNETYLVILNQVFNLTIDKNEIVLNKLNHRLNQCLIACLGQTLKVENKLFCFAKTTYFYLCNLDTYEVRNDSKFFRINEAFASEYKYSKYQVLTSIFIFKQTKTVFMTATDIFCINSESIQLNSDFSLSIKFNSSSKLRSLMYRTSEVVKSNEPNYLLLTGVLIPNLFLIFLLIYWLFLKRKKLVSYFKSNITKLNKLSKIPSSISKTIKKFRRKKIIGQKSEKSKKLKKIKLSKKSKIKKDDKDGKTSKMSKVSKLSKASKQSKIKENASQVNANSWLPNITVPTVVNNIPPIIPALATVPVYGNQSDRNNSIDQNNSTDQDEQVEFSNVLQQSTPATKKNINDTPNAIISEQLKTLDTVDTIVSNSPKNATDKETNNKLQNKKADSSMNSLI